MIPTAPIEVARRLRVPGYFILGIAALLPLLDFVLSVAPIRLDTVAWRFGAIGLFASALTAPLLILFFAYALALLVEDRKVVIVVGVIALLLGLIAIASSGAFALDALQMKGRVQPQAYARFLLASVQAMAKLILEGLAALVLAVSIFRTVRAVKFATARQKDGEAFLMGLPVTARGEGAAVPASTET